MSRSKSIPKLLTRKSPSTDRKFAYARFDGRIVSFGVMGPEAEQQFQQTLGVVLHDEQAIGRRRRQVGRHLRGIGQRIERRAAQVEAIVGLLRLGPGSVLGTETESQGTVDLDELRLRCTARVGDGDGRQFLRDDCAGEKSSQERGYGRVWHGGLPLGGVANRHRTRGIAAIAVATVLAPAPAT